jgi:tetratricopeptide (TPR) repeat protein
MKKSLAALLLFLVVSASQASDEKLWHLRNLGKAFYENSATQYEAVGVFLEALELAPDSARERVNYGIALLRAGEEDKGIAELKKAQVQDPSIPHTWFNLGISYKRQSEYDKALVQLEGMVERVPDDAIAHYNLGVLYKLAKDKEKALLHLERTAELDENLAGARFQLSTTYRQLKRGAEAKQAMIDFRRIKKEQEGDAVAEDLEWSFYSEIYETIDTEKAQSAAPAAKLDFTWEKPLLKPIAKQLQGRSGGMVVLDVKGNGKPNVLAWSEKGNVSVYLPHEGEWTSHVFESLGEGIVDIAPADFDKDGLVDLAVVKGESIKLYRNEEGEFVAHQVELPPGRYNAAFWLDYDHDYDSDLFLLGAQSRLLRNNGEAGFSEQDFPFVEGEALSAARIDLIADTQGMDIAVSYVDRPGVLYRDFLAGKYRPQDLDAVPEGSRVLAFDFSNDGWTDLAAWGKKAVLLVNDQNKGFNANSLDVKGPIAFIDAENRGVSELFAAGEIWRNQGEGRFGRDNGARFKTGLSGKNFRALAVADFDGNGLLDLAGVGTKGKLVTSTNRTQSGNRWAKFSFNGVKNLKLAPGSEVEVKAGFSYQKKIYYGLPLHFGLGSHEQVDAVRVTWPNGLIQNETQQAADSSYVYEEAQRLSGSCPMVFSWNGEEFEFIADVLGVAPLGISAGDGTYFDVRHDEYIQIAGESLKPLDGRYEIRITEELREIAYIDEVQLIAVDHPVASDIYINDKFKGPPFPEFRLFGVEQRHYPERALDHRGEDVLERVKALDRRYPDSFARDYAGAAELHHIELDFGEALEDNEGVLVLSGWVDWADGSTFLSVGQERPEGLVFPYLQVRDAGGEWQTVIEDMGLPAGKPKTIVVDLSGKFLSASRQVRIVTNLCLYWDEIFVGDTAAAPQAGLTRLHPNVADLRHRGFSGVVVHPQRLQPESFVYSERQPLSMWNPTPGRYTRFGDVRRLLGEIDDMMVVFGAGDELALSFDAAALPPLAEGWERDFILYVDGWCKDGDANTAFSQTVEPLPYHGMPQYPYFEPHRFPRSGQHRRYVEHYQTREALRLIQPLRPQTWTAAGRGR